MRKVTGIGFDQGHRLINRTETYNAGDRVIKIEEIKTKDLGTFIKETTYDKGKKVRSNILHLDKDKFERIAKSGEEERIMADLFTKCEEDT